MKKRFKNGSKLFIDDKELTIESSFDQKNLKIIKFKEYNDINEVIKFVGKDIYIDEKDLGDLEENEYYIYKLIGLDVYDNGQKVGEVLDVISGVYPNDVYIIKTDKDEIYLPAIKATIKKIDLENGLIEVENFSDYE